MYRVNVATKVVETLLVSDADKSALNLTCDEIAKSFIESHLEFKECTFNYEYSGEKKEWIISFYAVSSPIFVKE